MGKEGLTSDLGTGSWAWRWTPESGQEALVWGLYCEINGCPHNQQKQVMLRGSCRQAATRAVCQEERGPWGSSRPPPSRADGAGGSLGEVAVHENRSAIRHST